MKYFLCLLVLIGSTAQAESLSLADSGIKVNVLWPIYPGNRYRVAWRYALHSGDSYRTELNLGLGYTGEEDRKTEGKFSEVHAILGVRQYFGSAFHGELNVNPGQSQLKDHVTKKKDYTSTDLEVQAFLGYEWRLSKSFTLDLQAGAVQVVSKSNYWPVYEDDDLAKELDGEPIVPVGLVNVTYWF
jgi:hypothetical protein